MSAITNLITKETTKEQHSEVYKDYPSTTPKGTFENFHASTVEPIFCEVPAKSKVLDVGCNSGELIRMLRDYKECRVKGIDLSYTALKIAKSHGLNVRRADAEELPYKDASFDVVILREVLSHVLNPKKALSEIRRVLKPTGFLLGSTPHANLERIVWEEQRLHHRYYDEKTLEEQLKEFFGANHIRVLTGAQFSMGFATTMLSDQPAEMLFKCGNIGTLNWDEALMKDNKTLRVWLGPTLTVADAYYRVLGYGLKMRNMKDTEVAFDEFKWNSEMGCSDWQTKISRNSDGNPESILSVDALEKCLKVANPWIFQITYSDDVLGFMELAKKVYPGKKLITDTDDWIFNVPGYNVASYAYRPSSEKEIVAYEQYKLSDYIFASTEYLKERITEMFPDKKVFVFPNSIDFDLWDSAPFDKSVESKKDGIIRIGYTGSGNHDGDIEIIKPVIVQILNEFENVEFWFAQEYDSLKDIQHPRLKILKSWAWILNYPTMIKSWDLDIGIAPLRDNEFNRAKSNLRWLEYSALKIPTVMSPVRPFKECVIEGEDGLLAGNKNVWYALLKKLIQEKELRKKIGLNAYERVKKDYNMDVIARKYASTLKEIRDGRQ